MNICSMRQANLGLCASAASNAGMQTHQEEYASKASQDYFGFLLDSLILSLPLSPLSIGLSLLAHCCCIARHVHLVSRTDTSLLCLLHQGDSQIGLLQRDRESYLLLPSPGSKALIKALSARSIS